MKTTTTMLLLFPVLLFGQFPVMSNCANGIIIMGQSNTGYFVDGGGLDSLKSGLIEANPNQLYEGAKYGRGGTYLDSVVVLDWNAASVGEFSDSISYTLNGFRNVIPHFVTTGDGQGFGFPRNGYYNGITRIAVKPKYLIWLQGENDSQGAGSAGRYEANLRALIKKTNAQLNEPDLIWIFVRLGGVYQGEFKDTINTAFESVAASDPTRRGTINLDDFTGDYYNSPVTLVHYNQLGAETIAGRILVLINTKGW